MKPQKRESVESNPNEAAELVRKINAERELLKKMESKLEQSDYRIQKVVESNEKHSKRLLRHQARLQELKKCAGKPEYFLAFSGAMNEYVQAFMISHNFEMNIDPTAINPDQMSYEQLIDLGQKIGKVSKGLTKEQIEKLEHVKLSKKSEDCPICCNETSAGDILIILRCNHRYHQECILEWLKTENKCPMCKTYVLEQHEL